ncbi:hypothetical protein DFH07DRAFT_1061356 [Mycena maculata]|uniref:F-box domain-containing protein n=1 Tax=Mycena maculata TaxID=230809 RepID=A0AAD7IZK1_9AGAR|nr:hypothetical protein DFH07DRAFT_1061356 [Mycena maculata]
MSFLSHRPGDPLQSSAILYPILLLPPEILAEIFSFVVDATFHFGDISEVSGPASSQAPWLLTRVCHRWTEVALRTPCLWSMVFLDLDRVGERGDVQLTRLRHDRSRNAPLTVKIFCEQDWRESHPVLDAAMAHCERWGEADLYITLPLAFQLAAVRARLSALITLGISLRLDDESEADPAFWDTFMDSPNLKTLCASFWDDHHLLSSPFAFPWHQLTRLSTTFFSNTEALSVLQALSSAIECRLEYAREAALPEQPIPTCLPYLRSLLLQMEEESRPSGRIHHRRTSLLDWLETPSLEHLSTYHTADAEAVLALLARSHCAASLHSFHFHSSSALPDVLLLLVQAMPCLMDLEIGDFNGALSTRSAVSTFVRALSVHWETRSPPRQPLSVWLVDRMYSTGSVQDLSVMYKDGFIVEISPNMCFRSLVADSFR